MWIHHFYRRYVVFKRIQFWFPSVSRKRNGINLKYIFYRFIWGRMNILHLFSRFQTSPYIINTNVTIHSSTLSHCLSVGLPVSPFLSLSLSLSIYIYIWVTFNIFLITQQIKKVYFIFTQGKVAFNETTTPAATTN